MTEDDPAVRILRTMPDEPPLPSTVDVERTMAEGRRRRRTRRWSGGVALVAVTAVAAGGGTLATAALRDEPAPVKPVPPVTVASKAPAPVPKNCKVTLLPSGGIKKALVTAGDPTGRYFAGRVYPPSGVHTVLWKDGVLQPVPKMPGDDAGFRAINSSGVAVGSSFEGDQQYGYVLEGGTVTRLKGGPGAPSAIDDSGLIVGSLGDPSMEGTPVKWASSRATPEKLKLPSGYPHADANLIGEDGTIVGAVYQGVGEGTTYLWRPDGTGRLLPRPKGADYFWTDTISNGWLYGRAVYDSDRTRDFTSYRYSIATGKYEKLATELSPSAYGAENGWVAGVAVGPVIIAGKKVVDLPRYQKMREYMITAYSADGKTAAGYSYDNTDSEVAANRPLKWTCR
ncbi:hypothetical protein OWR29_03870 [Actinoplanes sp. Pm04-4]|uniref:Uncharacterized protein n=1 Tax=Paractinoplanes pyxinae TaxID=2997416 RepID=A0ABT4AS97_9ACTN|nr:hypothetical protein [Actinoplanes pyxinae]MCY1137123.1 hypothetical protein [Actinoplanes pyxinae]